jgi:hypothetical protein
MPEKQTRIWSNNFVDGRYSFYYQAEQMLDREPSSVAKSGTLKSKSSCETPGGSAVAGPPGLFYAGGGVIPCWKDGQD